MSKRAGKPAPGGAEAAAAAPAAASPLPDPTAFEAARAARVARNAEQLARLGVARAASALGAAPSGAAVVVRRPKQPRPAAAAAAAAAPAQPAAPVRTSRRVRARASLAAGEAPGAEAEEADGGDAAADAAPAPATPPDDDPGRLLTCDEYLARRGLHAGPLMTGRYTGWVNDGVRSRLGIAADAAAAWEGGGGGAFERRPPKGESAKEFARAQLRKNPNAYFYRHNPPGEETWQGEWGEARAPGDEVALFVSVATSHGCGDKWGLFASHVPHRVGYQCSAAYRHILLPRGLLRDDQYRMTLSGEAVYVGRGGGRNKRRRAGGDEGDE